MARVLIVEDYPSLQTVYKFALEQAGHKVDVTNDGSSAKSLIRSHPYDLLILDLLLQKIHGLELLHTLNIPKKYPNLKVLVMSNVKSSKVVEEALELGVSRYLIKSSCTPADLVRAAGKVLGVKSGEKVGSGEL